MMDIKIEFMECVDSTNTVARRRIDEGADEWHTVVAHAQSNGEGRLGRSFFSPDKTGLYMSTVLYPDFDCIEYITGGAAVAVCRSLEELGLAPRIKWVNDIFIGGKKVCGILAKAIHRKEGIAVILGIGVNVYKPKGGFPEDIRDTAGYLFEKETNGERQRLFERIIYNLQSVFADIKSEEHLIEYRKRCLTTGKKVSVIPVGKEPVEAVALSVDGAYHLTVRYADGKEETLNSGEVSVRI